MSLSQIQKYVGAGCLTLNALFFVPKKTLEMTGADKTPATKTLFSISLGISIIGMACSGAYYYDKYLKLEGKTKWLIYGFVSAHLLALGITFYLMMDNKKSKEGKIVYGQKSVFSGYVLPGISAVIGAIQVYLIITYIKKTKPSFVLSTINKFTVIADIGILNESLKPHPEFYIPVQMVRAELMEAQAGAMLLE